MNIAQALAIAAAGYVYALSADQPLSARLATAHTEICTTMAKAEAASEEVLADSRALILAAFQQNYDVQLSL
ncbi:MAG TPA: hypothetical protein VM915_00285 [Verrucomicrobiae bacterium]|nr:hypothetical protein [Verrucomicrobiae bacterium]